MTNADKLRTVMLLNKAIDLRLLERKFSTEDNRYLTGFVSRFLDTMLNRLDRKVAKADRHIEMYEAIGEYWINISGEDGIKRLNQMAHKKPQDLRDMCTFLIQVMDSVHNKNKMK